MLTENELTTIIKNIVENEGENINGWDSLTHISVLVALDEKLSLNLSDIQGIEKRNSIVSMINLLRENKIFGEEV